MRRAGLIGTLVAATLLAGCLVEVRKVDDPSAAFAEARAEAARVQGRSGRPGHVEVLVYDQADGRLVRASLPMWLVRKAEGRDGLDLDLDDDCKEAAGEVRRHLRLEDLERAGLGVLVEAEEEDGDQVLVWLR